MKNKHFQFLNIISYIKHSNSIQFSRWLPQTYQARKTESKWHEFVLKTALFQLPQTTALVKNSRNVMKTIVRIQE